MKTILHLLIFCAVTTAGMAQTNFDMIANGSGNYQLSVFLGADSNLNYKGVPYDRIKDSPFWRDNWSWASLYDQNNRLVARSQVLFNLATGEFYFRKDGQPLVADQELIRRIAIHPAEGTDSVVTSFQNRIPSVYVSGQKFNSYVQVFHQGPVKLLKVHIRELTLSEGNGGVQKYYFFRNVIHYFLQVNNKVERLTRLSKDDILEQLPGSLELEPEIRSRRWNLKQEQGVVQFINYYNTVKGS